MEYVFVYHNTLSSLLVVLTKCDLSLTCLFYRILLVYWYFINTCSVQCLYNI